MLYLMLSLLTTMKKEIDYEKVITIKFTSYMYVIL